MAIKGESGKVDRVGAYLRGDADINSRYRANIDGESHNEGVADRRLVAILSSTETILRDVAEDLSVDCVRDLDDTTQGDLWQRRSPREVNDG